LQDFEFSVQAALGIFNLSANGLISLTARVACHAKRKKLSGKTQKIPFKMTFGYILKGIFLSM